ncbi:hypothetical protein K3495_g2436 [Podosphaera aphanis]|nr:hypothetical protein K3495_g2436 [Podosphaera aphanis]
MPESPQHDSYSRTSAAYRMISMDRTSKKAPSALEEIKDRKYGSDLAGQISRKWKAGDVYAPHDLHQAELSRYKQRTSPSVDAFDLLELNPLEHYRNFSIMSEWMTPMGRIKSRKETGLRPVNQRRIAKAIRRSIGIGMMSSVHRHPEILYKDRLWQEVASKKIY